MAQDDMQKSLSTAMRIGVELAVSIVAGALLGYALDRWLGTLPWLMLGGLLLGTVVGFRTVWRLINEMEKDSKKD